MNAKTWALFALAFAAALLTSISARAQDAEPELPYDEVAAFDREFAVAIYGTGHAGSYFAGGMGGRLRWQPFADDVPFGLEAYVEATVVDWPGEGFRHDYPNGFNVFVPIRLSQDFRLRGFIGFCDILSFVEPAQEDAPRADDVLFGIHGGFGAEWAVHSMFSLFADAQANVYMGHDRSSEGWTGGVDEEFTFFWNAQLNVGLQFHLGR